MSDRAHNISLVLLWCAFALMLVAVLLGILSRFAPDKQTRGQCLDGMTGLSAAVLFLVIAAAWAEFA